jgi:hypothetical protein
LHIADTDPGAYLATLPDDRIRNTMITLDAVIVGAMSTRRRVLWEGTFWGGTEQSIVGYGDMVQSRSRGPDVEWFIVGLARQKNAYSVYVNAVEDGAYLGHRYADRLGKVKLGSASIGFGSLDDLDLEVFSELIARADELAPPDRPG